MQHIGQFIMNHPFLWAALIIVLILILINESITGKRKSQELTPQSAVDMMNNSNSVVIDLRDKEAFKNGHIIDAVSASEADFEQQKMDKYKNKPLILVCPRGQQSPAVALKLKSLGFNPKILSGGMAAWQSANMPIVKSKG